MGEWLISRVDGSDYRLDGPPRVLVDTGWPFAITGRQQPVSQPEDQPPLAQLWHPLGNSSQNRIEGRSGQAKPKNRPQVEKRERAAYLAIERLDRLHKAFLSLIHISEPTRLGMI